MYERRVVRNGCSPVVHLLDYLVVNFFLDICRHDDEGLLRRLLTLPRRSRQYCADTAKNDPQCLIRHLSLLQLALRILRQSGEAKPNHEMGRRRAAGPAAPDGATQREY